MSTEEWRWKSCEGLLVPVITPYLQHLKYRFTVIRCNCSTDCSSLRCSYRKNNVENVHPLAVSAEAQLEVTLYNQMNLTAVVKITRTRDLCVLLVKLSALRCLRDDCLYFKTATKVLINTIYEKQIKTCCFVFNLDFMMNLKALFYLDKYRFRHLKLVIHSY